MQHGAPSWYDAINAGKEIVQLDLKDAACLADAQELCDEADVILDGFRPGVFERLGLRVPETRRRLRDHRFRRRRVGTPGAQVTTSTTWAGRARWPTPRPGFRPCRSPTSRQARSARSSRSSRRCSSASRTGRGPRITISMTHGAHRLVAHRRGGDVRAPAADRRCSLLPRLPDGRQTAFSQSPRSSRSSGSGSVSSSSDRISSRASTTRRGEDLAEVIRARPRRVARDLRRRGRLRRPCLDARGGRSRVRRAVASSGAGSRCRSRRPARARTHARPSGAPSPPPR